MSRFVRLLVCVVVSAGLTAEVPSRNPELEVQQASEALGAARQRRDAAAFAAFFTHDGVFMIPGLPDAAGRDAVRTLAEKHFGGARVEDLKIREREIRVSEDYAYELAWYSETSRGEEQSFRLEGRQFIIWKRGSDNAWRVQRYLYNFAGARPVP
jgi:uncharacterized protein (TIGR02246 family)